MLIIQITFRPITITYWPIMTLSALHCGIFHLVHIAANRKESNEKEDKRNHHDAVRKLSL